MWTWWRWGEVSPNVRTGQFPGITTRQAKCVVSDSIGDHCWWVPVSSIVLCSTHRILNISLVHSFIRPVYRNVPSAYTHALFFTRPTERLGSRCDWRTSNYKKWFDICYGDNYLLFPKALMHIVVFCHCAQCTMDDSRQLMLMSCNRLHKNYRYRYGILPNE